MKVDKYFLKSLFLLLMTVLLLSTSIVIAKAEDVVIDDTDQIVYLTFDDGPSPVWTSQVLDLLDFYRAEATFYMIGRNVVIHPEIVREVAEHGQTIGVHTYNHIDLSWVDYTTFYYEVADTESVIKEALQDGDDLSYQFARCVRPPYGGTSNLFYANANSMDYEVSMWNIDTKDWTGKNPEEILKHFRNSLAPNKVVLMHDGGLERENTIQALHLILHEILMQGYQAKAYCTQDGQAIKTP